MEAVRYINKVIALPLVGLILLYQKTLSPDHGFFRIYHSHGYCKFYPSCSQYARITLLNQGITGIYKIIIRIIKCNPLSKPAVDIP